MSMTTYREYQCAFCTNKKRTSKSGLPDGWVEHVTEPWEREFKHHYICPDCMTRIDKQREIIIGKRVFDAVASVIGIPAERLASRLREGRW